MFIRNRLYAPVEDGTDGGGGDGGAPPDKAGLVPADQPPAGGDGGAAAPVVEGPDAGEPKQTMFDAVKAALGSGDGAPAKPAEAGAPAAKPAPAAEVRPEDKYKVPADLSPKGQERFKELVSEIKTKGEEVAQLTERVKVADGFLEAAKSVGAGPQEFGQFFEFMGQLRNKPEQAIKFLENQISLIAREHGLAAGGNEEGLLSRHADLRDEVESYRLTRERALEIAQAREQGQRRETIDTQTRQEQARQEIAKQTEDQAIDSVTKWADKVRGQDIDWGRKKDVLFGQLAQIVKGVSPEHWLEKIEAAYKLMGPIKAPPANPAEIRRQQPLRASTGSGAPQAGSMQEAIQAGLQRMAGG
jgi:hypothetical protein